MTLKWKINNYVSNILNVDYNSSGNKIDKNVKKKKKKKKKKI